MNSRLPRFLRFLEIQSNDPDIVRQSRLLQILVFIILFGGVRGIMTVFGRLQTGDPAAQDYLVFFGQAGGVLLFTFTTFYLLHRGRFLIALNICFILLNLLFYSLLVSTEGVGPFHLLMLISVFSIAALQSIRVSVLYLALILAAVSYYFINNQPNGTEAAISYIQVALLLTAPSWFFANDLRRSRDRGARLAKELEAGVARLDLRTKELEQIADVGRAATASLDKARLLRDTVELIQSRFGFYHVRILLLSADGSRLNIEAAGGETNQDPEQPAGHLTVGQLSIAGWVALNRQARIALDVGEDPYYFNEPALPDTRSEVALPLASRGRLLGVLDVHSRETNAFEDEDVAVLQVMADQIANGLDNARLFEEIRHQADLLAELQTISNLMSQQANTANALNVVADRAAALFDADGGGVFLHRPAQNNLKLAVNLNPNDPQVGDILEPGEGLSGRAFAENKTLTIDDYATWDGRSDKFSHVGFHTAVAIPLRRQTEPIGVLALTRNEKGHHFKPDEIQIAELLAAQVSAVILNNELIEETRRLVQRERNINQAAGQIRRSLDAKTILDTTAAQLGQLFGGSVVKARLFPQQETQPDGPVESGVGETETR